MTNLAIFQTQMIEDTFAIHKEEIAGLKKEIMDLKLGIS